MEKFVCPICGKTYENAIDMANCIVKDDKEDKAKQKTELIEKKRATVDKAYSALKEAVAAFNTIAEDGEYYTVSCQHSKKKSTCGCKTTCCKEKPKSVKVKINDKDINPAEFEDFLKKSDFKTIKEDVKKHSHNSLTDNEIERAWNFLLGLFD